MFNNNNQEVKNLIKSNGLKEWQVAYVLKITEPKLSTWFRLPLSKDHKSKILNAIKFLCAEKKKAEKDDVVSK